MNCIQVLLGKIVCFESGNNLVVKYDYNESSKFGFIFGNLLWFGNVSVFK
jgi:hypothetical protein